MKKPNWNKWTFIEELTIKEAVLLSLDVEPDKWLLELDITAEEVDEYWFCILEPCDWRQKLELEAMYTLKNHGFYDLMEIARRNARALENPKLKVKDSYADFGYSTVNTFHFAEWVKPILEKMGRSLPPEFPIGKISEESDASEQSTATSRRLETMRQVNKEHPDLKTKKEVLEKCQGKNKKDFSIAFTTFSTGRAAIWNTAKESGIRWKNIG